MTAGYDDWALARTPSLLAFATALVDDVRLADAAVARALARTRDSWPRVSRDDPDLEARRQVVRACATPRRAAVVLRVLEGRSDAEIAEVLHCSEAAARRHLERGLAELGPGAGSAEPPSTASDDLVARAGAAPVQLLNRLPAAGATTDAPARPHRGPWLACLAVLALVCGVAFVAHESSTPSGVIRYPKITVPATWRYESYAGVQLQVPDTWGWGSSPVRASIFTGPQHLGACGTNQAAVLSPADDSSFVSALTQFVGRPSITNERCVPWGSAGAMPNGEAVWFDSPLEAGVRSVGSTVAETRVVGRQHVTVFGLESSLRRQILGTAQQVDLDGNGCPTRAIARATAGPSNLEPDWLSVCIYSQDTGAVALLYSAVGSVHSAQRYAAQVRAAEGTGDAGCPTPKGRWVALGLHGKGGTRWDVVNLQCGRIQLAGGRSASLLPQTVREWAVGGVTAYLSAPAGTRGLDNYFQAPAG
jgi:DNA-binding CsgD family transcriptional regulator